MIQKTQEEIINAIGQLEQQRTILRSELNRLKGLPVNQRNTIAIKTKLNSIANKIVQSRIWIDALNWANGKESSRIPRFDLV